jgi:peptide/nickel transport system ATP-binding protein
VRFSGHMNSDVLRVKGLRTYFKTYRGLVKAVDGVTFSVHRGDTLGIAGETGSGKSVTALSIMRLISPPGKILEGEILFNELDLLDVKEDAMEKIRGKDIAMVFQDPMTSLNPVMKIRDQICEVFTFHQGMTGREARERSLEMMRSVAIADPERVLKSYPIELSGGMRQRVMIAMALAAKPELLLSDEATTALDVTIEAGILELMKELRSRVGTSIMWITHNLGVIAEICNRVAIMYAGRIVEIGETSEVFRTPLHPYTIGLLGCMPRVYGYSDKLDTIPGIVPDLVNPPLGCRFNPRCKYARDFCKKDEPELVEERSHHFVSCHYADEIEGHKA